MSTVLERLEGTYLVRLFSEFETALRHYLRAQRLKQPSRAEALINKVRNRVNIPDEQAQDVHAVREYRNALVHDVQATVDPVELHSATKYLSTFLSWLQRTW